MSGARQKRPQAIFADKGLSPTLLSPWAMPQHGNCKADQVGNLGDDNKIKRRADGVWNRQVKKTAYSDAADDHHQGRHYQRRRSQRKPYCQGKTGNADNGKQHGDLVPGSIYAARTNLILSKSESLVFVKPSIQLSGSGGAVRVWIIDGRSVKCRFPSLGH